MPDYTPTKDTHSSQFRDFIAAQATQPIALITPDKKRPGKQRTLLVLTAIALLGVVLLVLWHPFSPAASTNTISTQTFTTLAPKSTATLPTISSASSESSSIQVYIVGAIKHPGVYTLPATARVYQLVQAAGGPLANANLLQINLAAKLSDGQEIYVSAIGETPPILNPNTNTNTSTSGGSNLVNINTATVDDLRQQLHLSQASAQRIVTYRLTHGNFTSIDQLAQAVSTSIYNKIKNQVTLS